MNVATGTAMAIKRCHVIEIAYENAVLLCNCQSMGFIPLFFSAFTSGMLGETRLFLEVNPRQVLITLSNVHQTHTI